MRSTIYSLHAVDAGKLATVIAEMRVMSAPTIRAVDCGDHLIALEGTHRLAAAATLGIAPRLEVYAQDDQIDTDSLDWAMDLDREQAYTAGELAGIMYGPQCGTYAIDDSGMLSPIA